MGEHTPEELSYIGQAAEVVGEDLHLSKIAVRVGLHYGPRIAELEREQAEAKREIQWAGSDQELPEILHDMHEQRDALQAQVEALRGLLNDFVGPDAHQSIGHFILLAKDALGLGWNLDDKRKASRWGIKAAVGESECSTPGVMFDMETGEAQGPEYSVEDLAEINERLRGLLGDLRPEVVAFAQMMEAQLKANDHKPGWKDHTAKSLLLRVREEVDELYDAVNWLSRGGEIGREAADVANMAMMVADVSGDIKAAAGEGKPE